jgi:hypothetical protein
MDLRKRNGKALRLRRHIVQNSLPDEIPIKSPVTAAENRAPKDNDCRISATEIRHYGPSVLQVHRHSQPRATSAIALTKMPIPTRNNAAVSDRMKERIAFVSHGRIVTSNGQHCKSDMFSGQRWRKNTVFQPQNGKTSF